MEHIDKQQKAVCLKYGSSYVPAELSSKVGIAVETIGTPPLNALRHPSQGDTCGWYIWGGEKMSQAPDFFKALHVSHLKDKCPEILQFLGLAPGWRVLLAGEHEDVWYDEGLLNVEV